MQYRRVPIVGEGLVVAFDMCSSSNILEELTLCGDLERYNQLLRSVKEYLARAQEAVLFDPYKFTGDGWILLFPQGTNGERLFTFLRDFCSFFERRLAENVLRHLGTPPPLTGLTFGIEKGPLIATTIYGQPEYFGRALNVACRLQASIKDNDEAPAYKALVSNAAYHEYLSGAARQVKVWKVQRRLRNIAGGGVFRCRKIEFLNAT
jgi:class 3 adenylate cyclase